MDKQAQDKRWNELTPEVQKEIQDKYKKAESEKDNFFAFKPTSNDEYSGYFYNETDSDEYTFKLNPVLPNWIVVANYTVGDMYRINTFQTNTFFKGRTTTYYDFRGEENTYNTDGIMYRMILDTQKMTATMIMYNAKFTDVPQEPVKTVLIIKGLDLEFSPDGIKASGSDIIPDWYEAGALTPVPSFTINSVEFKTTNDYYTQAVIDYVVADAYTGHFEGSYLKSEYIK